MATLHLLQASVLLSFVIYWVIKPLYSVSYFLIFFHTTFQNCQQ